MHAEICCCGFAQGRSQSRHGSLAHPANRRQRCGRPAVSSEGCFSDNSTYHSTRLGDPDVTIIFRNRPERNIAAEYKSAKAKCGSLAGNAKDICVEEAKGKRKVAKAELEARYKPSKKMDYEVSVAKAAVEYAVAKEKCDDKAGNDKDVCVKEAKAALVRSGSDAKAQFNTSKANARAKEESSAARTKAKEAGSEARQDAAAEKRDADYAVVKALNVRTASGSAVSEDTFRVWGQRACRIRTAYARATHLLAALPLEDYEYLLPEAAREIINCYHVTFVKGQFAREGRSTPMARGQRDGNTI